MALINSVVLVGHLTRDAEIRYFNNGNAIVKFSIAQNRRKKVGETWQDEAMFFDVSYGGKGAESVHKYLTKGKQVAIQGELRQDRWEQEGQARSKVLIAAYELQLLGGGPGGERGSFNSNGPAREASNPASGSDSNYDSGSRDDHFEDDIPF